MILFESGYSKSDFDIAKISLFVIFLVLGAIGCSVDSDPSSRYYVASFLALGIVSLAWPTCDVFVSVDTDSIHLRKGANGISYPLSEISSFKLRDFGEQTHVFLYLRMGESVRLPEVPHATEMADCLIRLGVQKR
jgi:hypothetical protein